MGTLSTQAPCFSHYRLSLCLVSFWGLEVAGGTCWISTSIDMSPTDRRGSQGCFVVHALLSRCLSECTQKFCWSPWFDDGPLFKNGCWTQLVCRHFPAYEPVCCLCGCVSFPEKYINRLIAATKITWWKRTSGLFLKKTVRLRFLFDVWWLSAGAAQILRQTESRLARLGRRSLLKHMQSLETRQSPPPPHVCPMWSHGPDDPQQDAKLHRNTMT